MHHFSSCIGTTTVTVVVNKNGEKFWSQDLTVTVKKNATELTVNGIKDGGEYTIDNKLEISMPAYVDGKKVDTDKRSLTCDNESVKIVESGTRKYTVTFDKTGEFKLTAKSYQSKNYPGATQEKSFSIKVTSPDYEVKQTAYNVFTVTFSNADIAKKAADDTNRTLTEGAARVTQASEMIEVKQVGKDNEEISTFIAKADQKVNVVSVKMFSDLLEDTVYRVTYGDHAPVEFKAVKWIPYSMTNTYSYVPNMEEKGGTAKLSYKISTVEGVDITAKVSPSGIVEYTDAATKNEYDKYSVSGDQVDFFQDNASAPIKAKFTWYGAANNDSVVVPNDFTVLAKDTRKYCVDYYYLNAAVPNDPTTIDKKREASISVDEGTKTLYVRIAVDLDGDGVYGDDFDGNGTKGNATDFIYTGEDAVRLVTSNADKLVVDETTGDTYAPKQANEIVGVYVYYKDMLIDADIEKDGINPIPVRVFDKKTLADLTVSLDNCDGKYSYSVLLNATKYYDPALYYDIPGDPQKFKIKALDQFGNKYDSVKLIIEKSTDMLDFKAGNGKGSVEMNNVNIEKGDKVEFNVGGEITPSFTATSNDNAVHNVSFKVTAEDLITGKTIVKTFSFSVKNTTDSTITSQVVESKNGEYHVYGKDSSGYKVCGYYLDTKANVEGGSDKVYLDIFNSTGTSNFGILDASGKFVKLNDTATVLGGGLTKISSAAKVVPNALASADPRFANIEKVAKYDAASGSAISFIPNGNYIAKAYKVNKANNLAILCSASFRYTSNTHFVEFNWNNAYSENTLVGDVIDEAFKFTTYKYWNNNGWKWEKDETNKLFSAIQNIPIAVSYVENENMITFLYAYTLDPDGRVIGETLINRSVYIGVTK